MIHNELNSTDHILNILNILNIVITFEILILVKIKIVFLFQNSASLTLLLDVIFEILFSCMYCWP